MTCIYIGDKECRGCRHERLDQMLDDIRALRSRDGGAK